MKKLKVWAMTLCGLVLLAGTAFADAYNVRDHGDHYQNASTGLKTDVLGNLKVTVDDADRDFPLITNLFAGQQLTRTQAYQMSVGVPTMQYTRGAIMLTWACATVDTDSVRIAVRVYGATSSTSANWHLWTPTANFSSGDTCASLNVTAESLLVGRCLKPVSFWVARQTGVGSELNPFIAPEHTYLYHGASLVANTPARVKLRKIPTSVLRWGSANAVMLNLTDNTGAPCPFPYIRIEVFNASGISGTAAGASGTLTNIEANLWPRVQ